MMIKIKKIDNEIELPSYKREGDAGIDLRSAEDLVIKAGERKLVKTGIAFEIPEGYAGLVWDRGGMAAIHGIHAMAGVLDSNFRGEVVLVLVNLGKEDFHVEKNMRVAQMLIQKVEKAEITESLELSDSNRGENKFSSSGYK